MTAASDSPLNTPLLVKATGSSSRGGRSDAGLAPLLLTVTELIRQLMEAQIIRRMEAEALTESQLDEAAQSLQALETQVLRLCEIFEIDPAQLNIDLGELGSLLPKQGGYYPGQGYQQTTVLELLDRLLQVGIVVEGDVDLGIVNLNLICLKLRLVLTSQPQRSIEGLPLPAGQN
ncbi:hypothetical protein PROH_16410 [Prochlorothrix hollandica PCC 9006 = CALU 1027]|uniref:Protein gvpK n=1 Tax=Prochlorothrix hollandica PCC 9006 = CALU 1027 TaxID=317619 RepID=A0A0M2PYF9_PROHO|nr:hypothetical protein PROH_16410 [Prochlorothrix hollandica PCC 9006 = CALU 1027]